VSCIVVEFRGWLVGIAHYDRIEAGDVFEER